VQTINNKLMKICPTCKNKFEESQDFCPADGEVLEPDLSSLVGTTLDGQYYIEALLGGGGMGTVYRARHIMLGDRVAIKVIRSGVAKNPTFLRRFRHEGQAARRFRHPNAITVHDLRTTSDGLTYMVLEYVDGQSLDTELKKRGRFSPLEALEILKPVASALGAAHSMGVIHRDLKPDNIMISNSPDGQVVVKLLDLGLAKIQQIPGAGDTGVSALTVAGQLLGTPYYMSPEQWDGDTEIDGRADIYSLGVVFYELVAGERPFSGKTVQNLAREHALVTPKPLHEVNGDVPEAFSRAVSRAMAKDRKDRPATIEEFINELHASVEGIRADKTSSENAQTLLRSAASTSTLRSTPPTLSNNPAADADTVIAPKPDTMVASNQLSQISRSSAGRLAVVGLAILVSIGGWLGWKYSLGSRPNESAGNVKMPNPDSSSAPVETVEVIRYWVEVAPTLGNGPTERKAEALSLKSGQEFRFHFSTREHGYLYFLVSGGGNVPTTILTSKPLPNADVKTNSVEVGKDYVLPWLRLGENPGMDKCTIIFSPVPLTSPAFLTKPPIHALTTEEHQELEELRARAKSPFLKALTSSEPAVLVNLPKSGTENQPLFFEVKIEHN
jgi:serine/threonine protein kinase